MAGAKPVKDFDKPWFQIDDRESKRTLEQQLLGLDHLPALCKGKSVLDVGCAEGLISLWLVKQGASVAHGVELIPARVHVANELAALQHAPAMFYSGDVENFIPPQNNYSVVLLLGILHKLSNPTAVAAMYADIALDYCVVRLPPATAPVVIDPRSHNNPHDIDAVFRKRGYHLERETRGAHGEWCGTYKKSYGYL